jgi:hypothetical protein
MSRPTSEDDNWVGTEPLTEPLGLGRVGVMAIAATSVVDVTEVCKVTELVICDDSHPP